MTPEELDEARVKEAYREWVDERGAKGHGGLKVAAIAARLARENWTPPEPVNPDILAFREFALRSGWTAQLPSEATVGELDNRREARAYLAGARMAREQERARLLVDQAKAIIDQHARLLARLPLGLRAEIGIEWQMMMDATASFYAALAKYRGEA